MATKNHSSKAGTPAHEKKAAALEEHLLVSMYRRLVSRHEKDAILLLVQSLTCGRLTKKSDKLSLRSLLVRGAI